MRKSSRLFRALGQGRRPAAYPLTPRQHERNEMIIDLGTIMLAELGTQDTTVTNLAIGMRLSCATFRFHFSSVGDLLFEILNRHLLAISRVISEIPVGDPHRQQRQRAAYLAYTRTQSGAFTETHLLMVRDRNLLPPDLRPGIELHRQSIGQILAGKRAAEALCLLDDAALDADRVELCFVPTGKPAILPALPALPAPPPAALHAPPTWTPSYTDTFDGPARAQSAAQRAPPVAA